MRVTKIICDRCGREIEKNPIQIAIEEVDRETGESKVESVPADGVGEYCKICIDEIINYIKVNPAERKEAVKLPLPVQDETSLPMKNQGKSKNKIDVGKVLALKNAGWSTKDIAAEMNLNTQAIYDCLCRYRKSVIEGGCAE